MQRLVSSVQDVIPQILVAIIVSKDLRFYSALEMNKMSVVAMVAAIILTENHRFCSMLENEIK
jgi:hypothetical protein